MALPPTSTTGAARRWLGTALLLVLPTLVACLVMLEVGLRLLGRQPSNVTEGIFTPWGEAYRLKPDQTKVVRTPSFSATVHTNALGMRDRAPGPRALARPYVAWLGDSATFANGVEYEESFVGRFGALAERRGIEVVNLAVGGHHLGEQEALLAEFLATAPRRPELVVAVFTPQLLALFEGRHHDLVERNGNLYPRERWVVPWLLVTLGDASSAYCFFRDGIRKAQARFFPAAPGAAVQVLKIYERTSPVVGPEATARLAARLAALDERIRAAGATPVHVYLPTTADLRAAELVALSGRPPSEYDPEHFRDALRRESERAGVQLVDLTDVLRAEHAKGQPLGFMQDMHYNPRAHDVIARELVARILGPGPQEGRLEAAAGRAVAGRSRSGH